MSDNVVVTSITRKRIGVVVLAAAVGLLGLGAAQKQRVYEPDSIHSELPVFRSLSEKQMIVDSTFGGIARRDHLLVSTYDRSKWGGKSACPT